MIADIAAIVLGRRRWIRWLSAVVGIVIALLVVGFLWLISMAAKYSGA